MTTFRDIIKDAYRESGIIMIGTDPSAAEHDEGERLLIRYIRSLLDTELGDNLTELSVGRQNVHRPNGTNYTWDVLRSTFLPIDTRLILNLEQNEEIYLNPSPQDGSQMALRDASANLGTYTVTAYGNGRPIMGLASAILINSDTQQNSAFYRSDLGMWVVPNAYIDSKDSMFPEEFDELLVTGLAIRLNTRFGVTTSGETTAVYNRSRSRFLARYKQTKQVPSEGALLRLTGEGRYQNYQVPPNDMWNIGVVL